MKYFLLIGQSNMAGRGLITDVPAIENPKIKMFRNNSWVTAVEPLHTDKDSAGVGLAMSFANEYSKSHPKEEIGLLPCAVGGTPLIRWMPEGDLYQNALANTKSMIGSNSLEGILWHQGEAETENFDNVKIYAPNLSKMLTQLRVDTKSLNTPIVLGELGYFLNEFPLPYFQEINHALHQVTKNINHCTIATAENLGHKGDRLHFNAAALRTFGERYFEQWEIALQ